VSVPFVIAAFAAALSSPARVRVLDVATPRAASITFAPLAQQGWRAQWDRDTGVPAWVWGGRFDVPGATRDAAIAERAARDFLRAHLDVLAPGAALGDLELVTNQLDGALRTVAFVQKWRGMRVVGGQVGVVIGRDRIVAVRSAAWPNVSVVALPAADRAAQRSRAESWLASQTTIAANARATGERVILPSVRAGKVAYAVADVFEATAVSGPQAWDVFVAPDGTPLARTSRGMAASATLKLNAGLRWGGGPRGDFVAPKLGITVDGNAVTTGSDGTFSWSGTANASVVTSTTGTYVRVVNAAGSPVMSAAKKSDSPSDKLLSNAPTPSMNECACSE
jgi:hypothetical protein